MQEADSAVRRAGGTTRRLRLDGLSLRAAREHSAFGRALAAIGLGAEANDAVTPEAVVLDWTAVAKSSAEGVAWFAVLVRALIERGVHVSVRAPERGVLRTLLEAVAGPELAQVTVEWTPTASPSGMRFLAGGAIRRDGPRAAIADFLGALSRALDAFAAVRRIAVGTATEALANIIEHACSSHAAALAVVLTRRRPQVVQLGFADNGIGVPARVLEQPANAALAMWHDAFVLENVLRRKLTARDPVSADGVPQGGGGLSAMLMRCVERKRGAVWIRSGGALLVLSEPGTSVRIAKVPLDSGFGSQLLVEVELA